MATTTSAGLTSSPICFNCGPMDSDGQCKTVKMCPQGEVGWLFPFIYSHYRLSDAPRGRLVVTGDSARIQDETTESSA